MALPGLSSEGANLSVLDLCFRAVGVFRCEDAMMPPWVVVDCRGGFSRSWSRRVI